MTAPRIDAHQHFWKLGQFNTAWLEVPAHAPIRRDFLPQHLRPLLDAAGVERSVFVQTQHDLAESRWALELADECPWICGVVGWVDLASPACEEQLLEFRADPRFVGVRHVTQDEPDVDFIIRPDVLRGLHVLERHSVPFDLLFYVQHLHHVPKLAAELPQLRMVIDHLSKPHIRAQRFGDWEPHFRAAARCPNVWCKLSGMITEADWRHWRPADLKPYIDIALEAFGPARLMLGSDWPVCELAGTYSQVVAALRECTAGLSAGENERLWGGTAVEFYGLDV
jgi:L-fuconolactonase